MKTYITTKTPKKIWSRGILRKGDIVIIDKNNIPWRLRNDRIKVIGDTSCYGGYGVFNFDEAIEILKHEDYL